MPDFMDDWQTRVAQNKGEREGLLTVLGPDKRPEAVLHLTGLRPARVRFPDSDARAEVLHFDFARDTLKSAPVYEEPRTGVLRLWSCSCGRLVDDPEGTCPNCGMNLELTTVEGTLLP